MCGILLTDKLKSLNSIEHRGTESRCINVGSKYLIHHRLPIQTLDDDEWSQPVQLDRHRYLLFNGEIFNYNTSKYGSDTEYLKDFFTEWDGKSISDFQKWDGFWAIVLYNSKTKETICLTDPLGKKLLYYDMEGNICSEIKGIKTPTMELDPSFISACYKWGYNHDDRTPYSDIKRILPGKIYRWKDESPETKTITNIEYFNNILIPEFYEDRVQYLRDLMYQSVKNRLLSKGYKIAVLLSGGLDSSIIAGILCDLGYKDSINWYTIENDETEYVNLLEKYHGIKVKKLNYQIDGNNDLKEIYSKWNESPIDLGSVVPQYYLFKAVSEEKLRIVLSGDGADELFGGYRRVNQYDPQGSDVFHELTYYHLPRLDKMSMAYTIELRNPFLGHQVIDLALKLPFEERKNKKILKDAFKDIVPEEIIERAKAPLKNDKIKKDPIEYRSYVIELFKKNYRNEVC